MQVYTIQTNEAGQRLDKFLTKYLPNATTSFFYKMLRKKNITLNNAKACGKEIIKNGDIITTFFSEETFEKFRGLDRINQKEEEYGKAYRVLTGIEILYEAFTGSSTVGVDETIDYAYKAIFDQHTYIEDLRDDGENLFRPEY